MAPPGAARRPAIEFCLAEAGMRPRDVDVVAYSRDPAIARPSAGDLTVDAWEGLRTLFVERAPRFLQTLGFDPSIVTFVRHHVAHGRHGADVLAGTRRAPAPSWARGL